MAHAARGGEAAPVNGTPTGTDERRPIAVPVPTAREPAAGPTGTDDRRPLTVGIAPAVDEGTRG
jgi:hypothetical protein